MRRNGFIAVALIVCALLGQSHALADEVIFTNGDRLNGTIKSVEAGKLTIDTKLAGTVVVDLKNVKTFSTDKPVQTRLKDNTIVRDPIQAKGAPATQPTTGPSEISIGGNTLPLSDIKRINNGLAWTGAIIANGSLARGNTHSTDFGLSANASLRRDDEYHDDRFSLSGAYNFGKQKVAGTEVTSADNWFAQAKYDKFFTDNFYGYGVLRYDHDRLAFLNYRLAPGVGAGYQWIESADFNFSTEAGVSYVYEEYSNDGNNDRVALRLAYHLDKNLNASVSIFHDLEWLPAFDNPADYNLNTDAGIRAKMTDKLFSEFKVVYQRDNTPAPGALKDDVRFLLGVGYTF
jgi:putative salt-induced outer membrane protein YdiY